MRKQAKEKTYVSPDEVLTSLMGFNPEDIGRPETQRGEDPQTPPGGDQGYPVDEELAGENDRTTDQADGAGGNYAAQELKPSQDFQHSGPTPYQQLGQMPAQRLSTIRKKLAELRRDLTAFEGSPEAFEQLKEAEENLEKAADALAAVLHLLSRARTPKFSPDGRLGGRGYIQNIKDMREELQQALGAVSSAMDTINDEGNNPVWRDALEKETFQKESSEKEYEAELKEKEGFLTVGESLVFDFSHPKNRNEDEDSSGSGPFFKGSPALEGDPLVE